jgi:sarcosine oxidase subunit alpha
MRFTFDGVAYDAVSGDTLAAALLRNGVRIVARGPYTGRPRGIVDLGAGEPHAFVQVESGSASDGEPMVQATTLEVDDGLAVRSLAGKGRLVDAPVEARYDKTWTHVDVLVVGAGRSGLVAALEAAQTGARVILADAEPVRSDFVDDLREFPDVRVLSRTTVTGAYEHGFYVAVERRTSAVSPTVARQRLWHIRASRVVLATGTLERPILFPDNDRPGIMLAGAAAGYLTHYGVRAGKRAVVFGCHDGALESALTLLDGGISLAAVVDARPSVSGPLVSFLRERGVRVLLGAVVTGTSGDADGILNAVHIGSDVVECDLLAVSGGWNPNLHLYSQAGGRTVWSDSVSAFVASSPINGMTVVDLPRRGHGTPPMTLWAVDGDPSLIFVDPHRDATLADLRAAVDGGMRSPEHVKRYTTIGTGADQGRTSGVTSLGALADALGRPVGELGATTYRPPVTPISFALLAGRDRGPLLDPARRTPMHDWHEDHGAAWENVGQWKRPWFYPRDGEDMDRAVLRECAAAREGVALMDVTTLGKIDLQGPDTGAFLDRIYTNKFSSLAVGHCRYGLMCRADGMIFDDGVTARLAEDRYHMTTTTGNAAAVLDWLDEWLQTEWPDLRVHTTSVTDQWAAVAVVGPRSRDVMRALVPGLDVSAEAFPFMTVREADIDGMPARIFRISFTGELSYEINVPSYYGLALWEAVYRAGEPLGITPYGTETMHVLRAEKGFIVVGQDTDGTVTPHDAGLGWAVSKVKRFVGERSFRRADTTRPDRKQLVGLSPRDPSTVVAEGAQLVVDPDAPKPVPMLGHVTSSYASAALGRSFALGLLTGGLAHSGETVFAVSDGRADPVMVTEPVFYDKEGARRDGLPLLRGSSGFSGAGSHYFPEAVAKLRTPVAHLREAMVGSPLRELPPRRQYEVRGKSDKGLWLGPDWHLVVDDDPPLGTSIVDVSAARTILELSGPHARTILEHGCSIDLHPRAFTIGRCAQTNLAKAPVILHHTAHNTYEIYVRASFADYLARWLLDAMVEYR